MNNAEGLRPFYFFAHLRYKILKGMRRMKKKEYLKKKKERDRLRRKTKKIHDKIWRIVAKEISNKGADKLYMDMATMYAKTLILTTVLRDKEIRM